MKESRTISSKFVPKKTTTCEICENNSVAKQKHFECGYCGKYICNDCAHYVSIFVNEYPRIRLRTRRLCPECKPKGRIRT